MTKNFITDNFEITKRKDKLEAFLDAVIDPEEQPYFISDEASVHDITLEEDFELIKKIKKKYNIEVNSEWLGKPLWKLLDYLYANSTIRQNL